MGQAVVSRDCRKKYTCRGPQQNVQVENLKPCGKNASCRGNQANKPTCICNKDFTGNGFNCVPGKI